MKANRTRPSRFRHEKSKEMRAVHRRLGTQKAMHSRGRTDAEEHYDDARGRAYVGVYQTRNGKCRAAVATYGEAMRFFGEAQGTAAESYRTRPRDGSWRAHRQSSERLRKRAEGTITQLERLLDSKCFKPAGLSGLRRKRRK